MNGKELQRRLSANLKELRKGKFTQETLAEAAGLSVQMINNIEGCRRWSSEDTLVKIAAALKIDIHQLFTPSYAESEQMNIIYTTISKKIISNIRTSVNELFDSMETASTKQTKK